MNIKLLLKHQDDPQWLAEHVTEIAKFAIGKHNENLKLRSDQGLTPKELQEVRHGVLYYEQQLATVNTTLKHYSEALELVRDSKTLDEAKQCLPFGFRHGVII